MSSSIKMKKGETLYDVLKVPRAASVADITAQYRKLALQSHPDRVAPERKKKAEEEFKRIGFAYVLLKDPKKRKSYDRTGVIDDAAVFTEGETSIADFVRSVFDMEVDEDDIITYEKKHQGSPREREEVKRAYLKHKGEFLEMLGDIFYDETDPAEEDRLGAIADELIKAKELKATAAWKRSRPCEDMKMTKAYQKRWKARRAEMAAVEKEQAALGKGGAKPKGLDVAIRGTGKSIQDAIMEKLLQKFGGGPMLDIDDAAFDKKRREMRERRAREEAAPAAAGKRRKKAS